MKAGLFGGGWQDHFDALDEAFDRHAAENMPPHPFGASVDAILTGYPDDASDSTIMHAAGAPVLETPASHSVPPNSSFAFGMDSGGLGPRPGLQFPQDAHGVSGGNSASFIPRGNAVAVPGIDSTDQAPSVWQSKAMQDAAARAAGDQFSPPAGFREPRDECLSNGGSDMDACTKIDIGTGMIVTGHNASYDHLGDVAKMGVDAHEDRHKSDIQPYLHWWMPNVASSILLDKDYRKDEGKFEVPALQAEIDLLQNHVDQNPNDPNNSAIRARILDRMLRIDGYGKQRR